jgi:hypothetical protein
LKITPSRTRFLLINNNRSGLVIDGSKESVRYIISDEAGVIREPVRPWHQPNALHVPDDHAVAKCVTNRAVEEILCAVPEPRPIGPGVPSGSTRTLTVAHVRAFTKPRRTCKAIAQRLLTLNIYYEPTATLRCRCGITRSEGATMGRVGML